MSLRNVEVELQSEQEPACVKKQGEQESAFIDLQSRREQICTELRENDDADILWKALQLFENVPFYTSKKLLFRYTLKGGEMFVDRKSKSITRSSIEMAYKKAVEMEGKVSGPKKLGVFGASYLYPVFIRLGVISCESQAEAPK
ncbi:MAG: hypothetical protein LUD01_03010 [Clostridiales bacterium]|nr:hypothetical protein [Clostridiales bacterium]